MPELTPKGIDLMRKFFTAQSLGNDTADLADAVARELSSIIDESPDERFGLTRYEATRQPVGAPAVQMTAHWVNEFVLDRERRAGGKLRAATKAGYNHVLGRFQAHFERLPLEDGSGPPVARRIVLDYVRELKNGAGVELSGNNQLVHLGTIAALYDWLKREHGFHTPDLHDSGILRRASGKPGQKRRTA